MYIKWFLELLGIFTESDYDLPYYVQWWNSCYILSVCGNIDFLEERYVQKFLALLLVTKSSTSKQQPVFCEYDIERQGEWKR